MTRNTHAFLSGVDAPPQPSPERLTRMESRLRADYVGGTVEVDEFERRLDRILRGDPEPVDLLRSAQISPDEIRFGPGMLIPVNGDVLR